jgi:hypothetical protein
MAVGPGADPYVVEVPVFPAGAIYGRILRPDGSVAQNARAGLLIARKPDIKKAFEERFEAKVEKINIKLMKDGKHAIIKLKEGYSAEEIGMRIGIF